MKFKVEFEMNDFLEEVPNYETFEQHYRFKDPDDFEDKLKEELMKDIKGSLDWNIQYLTENKIFKDFLDENKQEIIDKVIDKVSKSIIHNKILNEFKKQLDE